MEEKKAEISSYLRNHVSPIVTPLMEEMVKQRPKDLLKFTIDFVQNLIEKSKRTQTDMGSENEESNAQEQQAFERRLQDQLKKKGQKKKYSRQGISAEVYGQFNIKKQFVPQVIPKDPSSKNAIRDLLMKSVLFGKLNDQDINIVVDAMTIEKYESRDQVIKEGDEGLVLYIVGSGEYDCSKFINGVETYLKSYKTGQSFGQLALMYTAPRAASIHCSKPGTLYGLDRQTFKHIVQEAANKRRQKYAQILSKVSILSEIDPYQKEQLCDILKEEVYAPGSYIVNEGEQGSRFYMIAQGELVAEKAGKKVFQFKSGDYFGEIALVRNTPRQASVKCLTATRVLYIQRDSFKRMFGSIQGILKRNEEKYKKYICT